MDNQLLERVIRAHGGKERWQQVESIQLSLNIFGPILITKFKSPWLSNITACIYTEKPYVSFHNFPEEGMTSIFDAYNVYIFDDNDQITSERDFSLKSNQRSKPRLQWDHLDLVYFLGIAVWNYSCSPFLLQNDKVECHKGKAIIDVDGSHLDALNVTFPSSMPCQSKQQVFYFSDKGLLRRNDYIGKAFSPVSIGTSYYHQYETVDGFAFPTRRTLFPRLWNGRALKQIKVMDGFINDISINWRAALT
ncbi:MAG: hypothetical protein OQK47_03500 [Gammaproteobacteria bacterium]|nr:hypothetical protein [Gammaproteobacteria bacterium]